MHVRAWPGTTVINEGAGHSGMSALIDRWPPSRGPSPHHPRKTPCPRLIYTDLSKVSKNLSPLRENNADVMEGFGALSRAALAAGALDEKTKELIARAIGVASRCDACLGFHARALVRLGATPEEFREMLSVAVYMGGGPSLMYAANALAAFEEFSGGRDDSGTP